VKSLWSNVPVRAGKPFAYLFAIMANATLSPKELANLLARLDDAQRMMDDVRNQLIRAMAARRRPPFHAQLRRPAPRPRR
jgi:hypothetical protein